MNINNRRTGASRIAVALLAALASTADAQVITEWDLPGQPLATSLRAIAARSESNILFDKKLVSGQSAPPLKMKATTEEALTQLLKSTGLTYRKLDDKTLTIQLASADKSATTSAVSGEGDGRTRLAQATTGGPGAAGTRTRTFERRPSVDVEEIIVTGTNIRGIDNNTAPVVVLSREYIDSTGFGTTTRLIESLPQNFALANQTGVLGGTPGISDAGEQGAAINLRGIGEGTTLVLLNGRRLAPGFRSAAVDISALPLTAIQQVEVLTDGASAIYGSDAVGGVVNLILRDDFEGAETRVRAGVADGTHEYRLSQALGNSWNSGNALLSVEYYKRDLLLASDRDFVPSNSVIGSLLPEDENYSAVFTGRQQLAGPVGVFADVLYTQRDSFNQGGRITLANERPSKVDNPQINATLGMDWQVGGDWRIELSGSYGSNDLNVVRGGSGAPQSTFNSLFESEAALIKADGTLLPLPGGALRMAIATDWRSDTYEDSVKVADVRLRTAADQIVRSGFAELYAPLVGEPNATPGVRKLELSLAGRYVDYSSIGSSFDPQYGLMWEPVAGFRVRARHGTSYKAPNLVEYSVADNSAAAILAPDPMAPFGFSYQLQVSGKDVDGLQAQESESSSIGLEFVPESTQGLAVTLNYYRIKYRNRIAIPPLPQVTLTDPAAYGSLFIRNPTVDQVNQFIAIGQLGPVGFIPFSPIDFSFPDPNFDPATVAVIVDVRRRNLSVVDTNGVDFSTRYDFQAGEANITLGVDATYILEIEQQVTTTSRPFRTDDTFNNPPNLRARGFASWQHAGWGTNLFVNYTDSYTDNRTVIPASVSSHTTVDTRVAYSFADRFSSGFLSGVTVAASVQNVLDEDPPRTAIFSASGGLSFDVGFDSTNANPLGRFFALELTKTW